MVFLGRRHGPSWAGVTVIPRGWLGDIQVTVPTVTGPGRGQGRRGTFESRCHTLRNFACRRC